MPLHSTHPGPHAHPATHRSPHRAVRACAAAAISAAIIALSAAALPVATFAQSLADDKGPVEEILITGSFIKSTGAPRLKGRVR